MTDPITDDPDAPWGRKEDGTPYKRDPRPFQHLKGKPFGTKSADAKASDPRPPGKKTSRPKEPPKASADHYGKRIASGVQWVGIGLTSRPAPGAVRAGLVVQLCANDMGAAWGPMATRYPWMGRTIDKLEKTSEGGTAAAVTMQTLAMTARAAGVIKDESPLARFIDKMIERKLAEWYLSDPEAAQQFAAQFDQEFNAGGDDSARADARVSVQVAG